MNIALIIEKIAQQIYLAGFAVTIAILIGVPIGIFISRHEKFRISTLSIASMLQTIPSLALLALLLPLFGIGAVPAIITLTVYAFLPIIRNTAIGISSIEPDIIEAANGLGFTTRQKLWMVEFPLALPVIIGGIRTATAMSIGIATLAAFIGAGGLGDFIYQGLTLNNLSLILTGAIPAAVLALVVDTIIAYIEKRLTKLHHRREKRITKRLAVPITAVAVLAILAIPFWSHWQAHRSNRVVIGSKSFSEQYILAYLMRDMIAGHTNLRVKLKLNLGDTLVAQQAIRKGSIDIYPEYTGTAYLLVLKGHTPLPPKKMYQCISNEYADNFQLTWLPPFGFNNQQALAVRCYFATGHQIASISDIKTIAKRLSIGVPPGFLIRPDAFPGLAKTYHLKFANVRIMNMGLMYKAAAKHKVDVIMAASTDGRIKEYNLCLLSDDKHLFPAYDAAPVIRSATLKKHPEIKHALGPLLGKLSNKTMQQLNYEVDVEHKTPAHVAKQFLIQNRLI